MLIFQKLDQFDDLLQKIPTEKDVVKATLLCGTLRGRIEYVLMELQRQKNREAMEVKVKEKLIEERTKVAELRNIIAKKDEKIEKVIAKITVLQKDLVSKI